MNRKTMSNARAKAGNAIPAMREKLWIAPTKDLLLLGGRLIHQPRQPRLAAGRVVGMNHAFLGRSIKTADRDAQLFLRGLDFTGRHQHAGALDGLAHTPAHLAIAFASFQTLTMSFDCRFVSSQTDFLRLNETKKHPPSNAPVGPKNYDQKDVRRL